ncbi:MAG: MFS transporter, partial [Dehalococcoidia bacterium]
MATPAPQNERVVNLATLPIFVSFFTWGFGTGAQNLGRPLFAYAVTGNIFLVGVMAAMNALPRMFTGPLTGYLTDRFGRKPLVILGPLIRGLTNLGQFFAGDFTTFLILELIGQIGVAMWNTSSSVLLSDVTNTSNRGRALALRHMSTRMGFVAGPLLGGVLALAFGLASVFLFNAITKVVIIVIVFFMVKETRPEQEKAKESSSTPATMAEAPPAAIPPAAPARRFSLEPFRDRSFIAL